MASNSLLLALAAVFCLPGVSAHPANLSNWSIIEARAYALVDNYNAGNFFSEFNFYTGADPTHGYVDYQSQSNAQSQGLINTNNNQVYLGVDTTSYKPPNGRASVRVSSNKAYTHGLFIADIAHMPGDLCGIWPAWWLFGPNWPSSGEIDVIEGVNLAGTDQITLHTSSGCIVNTAGSQPGTTLLNEDCNSGNGNNGCAVSTSATNAYGDSFNGNGGGVYAMQWASSGIYVWFFPRNAIPQDIQNDAPVTTDWGLPTVAFNGGSGCDIDAHFQNENIVFDTTFCGDWAGNSWSGSCAALADTCVDYVAQNGGAFGQGYWSINSVKVYQ
ncbi:hypothetical protein B7463_g10631, partial [Scytalidium lignicola]